MKHPRHFRSAGLAGARRAWGWIGALGVFALAVSLAHAAPGPADYFFQTWETEHGLPQNHSTAILQTRDGYLWLGTYNGLVRFDGARFVVFNTVSTPGLQSSRVTSLYEDDAGVLWIGHEAGELTRLRQGRFEPVVLATNRPGGGVVAIAEDGRGDLWVLRESGLVLRVRDGASVPPERGQTVPSLTRATSGTLWRVHGGKLQVIGAVAEPAAASSPEMPSANDFIVRACAARDGGLWLAGGERLRRWQPGPGAREREWGPVPWGNHFVTALMESRAGQLWAGTLDYGLFVLSRDGRVQHYTRTNGLPHDWVRSLGEDREGTVWIGTSGGVCAAREPRVTLVKSADEWQGRAVLSLCPGANDTMWAGTEGAGLYRLSGSRWTRFGEREGLTNLFVWSVLEDRAGRVWVGTWGGGLFQWTGGRFVHPEALAGMTLPVCALLEGRDGALWVGTQEGLLRRSEDRVERFARELFRPDVRALAEAKDGTIWFGLSGGGLGRLRDGRAAQFRRQDGLPSDYVWSLLAEEDGTLWIGTLGGGLCRLRAGKFVTLGEREGLPNNVICQMAEDGQGQLWMGSNGGILRAAKEDLHRCADGATKTVAFFAYGKADGMPSLECSGGLQPSVCQTADGRLWFPTSKGPVVADPAHIRNNALAPPVVIEEVIVEGLPAAPDLGDTRPLGGDASASRRLVIPPGRQRFEFRFAALSFVAPERVRFKYRLEDLEKDWVDAGTKRVANYSYLPPGNYTFRVVACNNDGVWNTMGASLPLIVQPHFWQTWWFQFVAIGVAGVGVGMAVRAVTRRRYRRKLERLERQRAIEKERTRIAKDIHDDLGASLTRITLLSQTARSDLDQPLRAAADLDRIYSTARELTRAMDEIVWAVNPHHDTLDSLVSYLGGFAQDFLSAAAVRCRLDVPLRLPAVPVTSEVRHNVFLAFKEAVHNVVRHSGAKEARVSFALDPSGFTLSLHDNGDGFDPAQPGGRRDGVGPAAPARLATGNGLPNMRKRLAELGGQCILESAPGRGTLVRFIVPSKLPR